MKVYIVVTSPRFNNSHSSMIALKNAIIPHLQFKGYWVKSDCSLVMETKTIKEAHQALELAYDSLKPSVRVFRDRRMKIITLIHDESIASIRKVEI